MKSFIRNLSATAEFLLVVGVSFSWGIVGSARQLLYHWQGTTHSVQITNGLVLEVVWLQLLALGFAFWVGSVRGWSAATLGSRISWGGTGAGVVLFVVATLAIFASVLLTNLLAPGWRAPAQTVQGVTVQGLTLPFVLLFSFVNPIYEEALGTGYFMQSLERFGMLPAVMASALFRTFLHSYQGLDAIVVVLPLGLVFGLVYWQWRQLWPLIVAHILFDLWALSAFVHASR